MISTHTERPQFQDSIVPKLEIGPRTISDITSFPPGVRSQVFIGRRSVHGLKHKESKRFE